MRFCPLCALLCVLYSATAGQWSAPALVWQDTTWFAEARLLCTPADTLWTAVRDNGWNGSVGWNRIQTGWSLGDSWSGMIDVTGADSWGGWYQGMGFGCDPRQRLWLGWYRGGGYTFQEDSWAVCTAMRDLAGWHPFRKSIVPFWSGGAESFAADQQGNWYMSVERYVLDSPGFYADAMYSRLDRDTWTYPQMIAEGVPRPAQSSHWSIALVPHPDSGLWEVDDWSAYLHETQVCLHRVLPDTVLPLTTVWGDRSDATADSAGRLWVVYTRDNAVRSLTILGNAVVDSQIVSPLVDSRPFVCTDPAGWVWAAWSCGWSVRVSYNTGQGWSPAETVASVEAEPLGIVSDSRGKVYVLFVTRDRPRLYTSFRTYRPGIEQSAIPAARDLLRPSTMVHGVLWLAGAGQSQCVGRTGLRDSPCAVLLDATGRNVMPLRPGPNDVRRLAPGVYFVFPVSGVRRGASGAAKVIVQK